MLELLLLVWLRITSLVKDGQGLGFTLVPQEAKEEGQTLVSEKSVIVV